MTEESDGVNDPEVSATVDGRPVQVNVNGVVLVDGLHEVPVGPRDDHQEQWLMTGKVRWYDEN